MQQYETFFVQPDFGAVRACLREFPALRRLLKRDDDLRTCDVLTVYMTLIGAGTAGASAAWNKAVANSAPEAVVSWLKARVPHNDPVELVAGDNFPRARIGLFMPRRRGLSCSVVVLPTLRILRWCKGVQIPTLGITMAHTNGVYVTIKEEALWQQQSL